MEKYRVIFYNDYGEQTSYTEEYFNSEGEAERWVDDQKSYSDDYDDVLLLQS